MRTTSAALVAAACLAAGFVPAASAAGEASHVSVELTPGKGMWENALGGWWEARSLSSFSVRITDTGAETLYGLTVYVSAPGTYYELYSYSGDRWQCEHPVGDDNFAGSFDCHITDQVVPGEAWPELTINGYVRDHMNEPDSIDVYARTGDCDWVHAGFPFKTDTST